MADDDYYPPLVHRSRFRPDETPFDPLQGSPAPSPFEMFNPAPVNPFGGDSEDFTTAHVNAAYDREQDYNNSVFGKVKNWLYTTEKPPEEEWDGVRVQPVDPWASHLSTETVFGNPSEPDLRGGGATVFGKGLAALGLDESGDRANTTWGDALHNTKEALNPFALAQGGANTMNNWASSVKYPEKLETPDMLAPFGLAAMMAPFAPTNAVGSLVGKLSQNPAHRAKIARAEEMHAAGASPDDIWKETRSDIYADGEWKHEIDDSQAGYVIPPKDWISKNEAGTYMAPNFGTAFEKAADNLVPGAPMRAKRVFTHGELESAYPGIMNTEMGLLREGTSTKGAMIGDQMAINEALPPREAKSTFLHELGAHGVQRKEGWATGGSAFNAYPADGKGGAWPIYRERLKEMTTPRSLEDFAKAAGYDNPADAVADHAKYVKDLAAMRKKGVPAHLDRAAQQSAAEDWYKRLAGEEEARAIQKRMDLTPEERDARPFRMDFETPVERQILRFNSDYSESSPFSPRGAEAPSGANSPDSLPMDEASRLARAREMGFDTDAPLYHGTNAPQFDQFDLSKMGSGTDWGFFGPGVYLAPNAGEAARYGKNVGEYYVRGKLAADADASDAWKQAKAEGASDIKARVNEILAERGFSGRDVDGVKSGSFGSEAVVFDPKNIRSKYAAFDPAKSDSPFLLAADQAKASLPGVFTQAAEREGKGPFEQTPKGIRAYHGSPHDFDRFDMSKIGTGEGAQAYGHGLYFADQEDVAKSYRDRIKPSWSVDEDPFNPGGYVGMVLDSNIQPHARQEFPSREAAESWARQAANEIETPGHMYEVNINADPEHFLDWDKPLSQQPGALAKINAQRQREGLAPIDAETAIDTMPEHITNADMGSGSAEAGSRRLREAGIPGIRYLDQGSRGAGEGSRNWVVFDDKIIEILKKYGIIAPPVGAGLFGATKGEDDEG
jgi:hypothetical protein